MKIVAVEPGGIAAELDVRPGDDLLEINGTRVRDSIDLRFHEGDEELSLKIARDGDVTIYDIEKDASDPIGLTLEEMSVLSCGNDCIFCFVDQNPKGLRNQLYFRDGDYRLSFMYGNYTTMTNAGPATLRRIIDQRLSPQYISVHVTDYEVRSRLMGLRKDDHILEKIALLHDNDIDMHTQIVLCPGINDGRVLEKTVEDLYRYRKRIISLAIVPVGLTDHRFGLAELRKVDGAYAADILGKTDAWQKRFRPETGRGFVYPSDEFLILAGREIPGEEYYDGFPQIENGVGLVRSFLRDVAAGAGTFPKRIARRKRLTLVTGELAAGFMAENVLPHLGAVAGLDAVLVVAPNRLYGRSVTVAGLLSGRCVLGALEGRECGDLILLPPDTLNADGMMLDDMTPENVAERLGTPVMVFDGDWRAVFARLNTRSRTGKRREPTATA